MLDSEHLGVFTVADQNSAGRVRLQRFLGQPTFCSNLAFTVLKNIGAHDPPILRPSPAVILYS